MSITPLRARQIISQQAMRGIGAEIEMTDDERTEVWSYVEVAPISMSTRDMLCRIGRGDSPTVFGPHFYVSGTATP
jgi:hypothetical protein